MNRIGTARRRQKMLETLSQTLSQSSWLAHCTPCQYTVTSRYIEIRGAGTVVLLKALVQTPLMYRSGSAKYHHLGRSVCKTTTLSYPSNMPLQPSDTGKLHLQTKLHTYVCTHTLEYTHARIYQTLMVFRVQRQSNHMSYVGPQSGNSLIVWMLELYAST